MAEPHCPDCRIPMEGGFPLNPQSGEKTQTVWVEGAPELTFVRTLKLRGRRQIPMYAWRCPRCTLVRLYAPE